MSSGEAPLLPEVGRACALIEVGFQRCRHSLVARQQDIERPLEVSVHMG